MRSLSVDVATLLAMLGFLLRFLLGQGPFGGATSRDSSHGFNKKKEQGKSLTSTLLYALQS